MLRFALCAVLGVTIGVAGCHAPRTGPAVAPLAPGGGRPAVVEVAVPTAPPVAASVPTTAVPAMAMADRVWDSLWAMDTDAFLGLLAAGERHEFFVTDLGFSHTPEVLWRWVAARRAEGTAPALGRKWVLPRRSHAVMDVAVLETDAGFVSVFVRITDGQVVKVFVEDHCCYTE